MDAQEISRKETIYDANDTMRMIGYQQVQEIFTSGARRQINEVLDVRKSEITFDAAIEMFIIGFIHGKRAERIRRKN